MLIYDITNQLLFKSIHDSWFKEAEQYMSGDIKVMMLVGNKEDLIAEQAVSTEEGRKLVADLGIEHFVETSCKELVNIDEAFDLLIGSVVQKLEAKEGPAPMVSTNTISISNNPILEKKKKGCVLW